MWSWAVTSLRVFGRLCVPSACVQFRSSIFAFRLLSLVYISLPFFLPPTHYFSTHGCARGVSLVCLSFLLPEPLAAASLRALRSKKLAMVTGGAVGADWTVLPQESSRGRERWPSSVGRCSSAERR